MKKFSLLLLLFFSVLLWGTVAFAIPVNLNNFSSIDDLNDSIADPTIVNIGTDTINFYENAAYGYIYAANDAFMVADDAIEITYDYTLTPGTTDDYDWLVALVDYNYVMEIERIGSGSFSIDMTPYQGQTISLAFGLEYDWEYDWGYDSIGTISNIDLATAAPVPEPATILLLGTGLAGLAGIRRKRKNKTET